MNETPTASPLKVSESGLRWLWIAALVIAADQWSKRWIIDNFLFGERLSLLPVLDIVRTHNTGAAFSFLANAGGWQRWGFSALATVVCVFIVIGLRRMLLGANRVLCFCLSLILGGAIGNLIDRVRVGAVTDFILAHWGSSDFPVFNLADSAITVGAAFVLIDAMFENRRNVAA